ncbi:MAG: DNA mismatch repair protein MutS [Oscillospiraceae bacterium]|nr:DNA mismatch repair protein MutS [Oscillospiraceae bacterium]
MAKTPMMQQYFEIKEKYNDYLLFYRLGDFYEMFYDDAKICSRELDLTLTGRDCGEEERAPMCGMPYHSADNYICRLVEKGYKVAVCEQLEDPAAAKGVVKRDVVRIVTPGTIIESGFLNEEKNNYLCSIYIEETAGGAAFADITSGIVNAAFFSGADYIERLQGEIGIFSPSEVLINLNADKLPKLTAFLTEKLNALINSGEEKRFDITAAKAGIAEILKNNPDSITGLDIETAPEAVLRSVGAILGYLRETQKSEILNVTEVNIYDKNIYMELDLNTRRNLEICETMRSKEKKGSLLWAIDKTRTSKGARTLRQWLEQPLLNCKAIKRRQEAVGELIANIEKRDKLKRRLSEIHDLDRIAAKIIYNTASPRDLKKLGASLKNIPAIKELLKDFSGELIREIDSFTDDLNDICSLIDSALSDGELPASVKEGGFIKSGYNADIDNLHILVSDNKNWIAQIEETERGKTGIKNLKIGYNRVFGYYIEISKSNVPQVPENYIRRQTLTNGERYTTEELKNKEMAIISAKERLTALERDIFDEISGIIAQNINRFQKTSYALSCLDALYSLAETAEKNNYTCPEVDTSPILEIKDGRHPVVELMRNDYYVPNDVYLDDSKNRLYIIKGPNMAGKSTYMRQVAIISLLAQIGSYVPASSARIGLVDRIFTRVGAADDLAAGQSTFMVEMSEVAYILKNATKKSLIIYDEIGRGTSTFDGMSVARAVLEYTAGKKLGAKTLFATHYHELTELENEIEGLINYNIAAKKKGEDIVFLHKIVKGAADDSYGIEVAQLAGVPSEIIKRAKEVLSGLETAGEKPHAKIREPEADLNFSFDDMIKDDIYNKLKNININILSPLEAFNALYGLIKMTE